jgi:hypothetical protein
MPDASHMALANAARAAQGIPQALPSAGGAGDQPLALPDLLAAMKSGQFSPQALLQLLAMLLGNGQAGPTQAAPQTSSPIEQAYLG